MKNNSTTLEQFLQLNTEPDYASIKFCEDFLDNSYSKYILGRTPLAKAVSLITNISGIVDEYTKDATFYNLPIINTLDKIPEGSLLLSTVTLARPRSVINKLEKLGIRCIDYFSFRKYLSSPLPAPQYFCEDFNEFLNENFPHILDIYSRLEDDISKKTFKDILAFKLSSDFRFLTDYHYEPEKEYFDDFIQFNDNEVFVDCGGYDGFTSQVFIKNCPKYKSIDIIEPIPDNMHTIKINLKKHKKITYHQIGLADKKGMAKMTSDLAGSKINETGHIEIKLDKLDSIIQGQITYIKMDLEGYEKLSILGAKELIKKYTPKLAISVYHRPEDFWEIPKTVLSINSNYKIYLRHYSESTTETDMYFIPKN